MRQGGLKPKGHNSGVYWTRAASKGSARKVKKEENPKEAFNPLDLDHDGNVTPSEIKVVAWIYAVTFSVAFVFVCVLIYLAILGLKS